MNLSAPFQRCWVFEVGRWVLDVRSSSWSQCPSEFWRSGLPMNQTDALSSSSLSSSIELG